MNKEKELILEELRTKKVELQEKAPQDIVIQNIKLLGTIQLNEIETEKEQEGIKTAKLYLVEEYNKETDEIILKYYADDEFIGIDNEGEFLPTGLALEKYENVDSIKDVLENLKEKEEIQKDSPEEEKTQEVYDLNELEEEEKEQEKNEKEKEEENDKKTKENKNVKLSDPKGEVDLDQQVNGETLRKILGLGEEYKTIAPVRASTVGVISSAEYCYIAIKADKTFMVLGEDILQEDRQKGVNPYEKDNMVNSDGDISKESSISGFKIVNRPNLFLITGVDKNSGTRKTSIKDVNGRESRDEELGIELEKNGDGWQNSSTRNELREEKGIDKYADMKERQMEHEESGCENDRVENIDEDKTNDTHEHIIITKDTEVPGKDGMTVEQWAEELGENTDIIVERLQREMDKDEDGIPMDIVEEIEADYERAGHEHKH